MKKVRKNGMKIRGLLLTFLMLCFSNGYIFTANISVPYQTSGQESYPVTITVTGIGKPAARGRSSAQKRLLAERAATVHAYHKLVGAVNNIDQKYIPKDTIILSSGFIRNARIIQKRYLNNGTVEVDIALTFNSTAELLENKMFTYRVDNNEHEVSIEQWQELVSKK